MKGRLKMKIAAAFKVVPDDQDIKVAGDRTLDYSKAKNTISVYDLNALEVAAQLAAEVETVEVPLPAVIAVSPDVALPRIAGMKDILAAGKKPQTVEAADAPAAAVVETVAVKAPEQADRKCQVLEDVDEFIAAVKAAL